MGRRLTIDEYYWAKINKEGQKPEHVPELGGCWLWTGALAKLGYGQAYLLGKQQLAHRVAWILAFGEIPQGLLVCHRCDVRNCVNPEHLFLGTHKDNAQDMLNKGRGRSKIPSAALPTIFARRAAGDTQKAIARDYGVSTTTISHILNRRTRKWYHDGSH